MSCKYANHETELCENENIRERTFAAMNLIIKEGESICDVCRHFEEASKPELGPAYAPAFARLKEACADL